MKDFKKKIDTIAREYAVAHTRFMMWDDCDAMHEIDILAGKWQVITDGKPTLKAYIKANLYEFFKETVRETAEETGNSLEEELEHCGKNLLLPYK